MTALQLTVSTEFIDIENYDVGNAKDGFTGDLSLCQSDIPILRESFKQVVEELASLQHLKAAILTPEDAWIPVLGDWPTKPISIELREIYDNKPASAEAVTEFFELLDYCTSEKGDPQITLEPSKYIVEFRVNRV